MKRKKTALRVQSLPKITYMQGGAELLPRIARLWRKLTLEHAALSPYFALEFKTRTFADRKRELLQKAEGERLRVILAYLSQRRQAIAYAVGTVNHMNVAELDSLYVDRLFRGSGIGGRLTADMLRWLQAQRPASVVVHVAIGNESVVPFYRRFGFLPRVMCLTLKRARR